MKRTFTVITISFHASQSGYKTVIVLNKNGVCYRLLVKAFATDSLPKRGDIITLQGKAEKLQTVSRSQAEKILSDIK